MRLIDRDLLLSEIEKSRGKNPHKDSKIRANHTIEHDHIAHLVLEQPTAYDVDKVMEQIRTSGTDEDGIVLYVDRKPVIAKELVAEIVKSGGIE